MLSTATLAGGCFWCTEAVFRDVIGVSAVESGYIGGTVADPSYKQVCSGTTGHAEVVQVHYDPAVIDYPSLLMVFFTIHDPTTLNRQGHDVGSQYRSAIFYHDKAQRQAAEAMIAELNAGGYWSQPIVTELVPASQFHVAENYHHQYFRNNPYQGYCMAVVAPKALKVKAAFASLLKSENEG